MSAQRIVSQLFALLAAVALAACGEQPAEPPAAVVESPAPEATSGNDSSSVYEAAVMSAARPEADRARDASRKPAEVLEFIGIEPGMTVLDLFTGGGYYAELISSVVGPGGKVVAQTNKAYLNFVGDSFEERFGSERLGNVDVLMAENNELKLEPDTFDVVMLVLSFHDLYYAAPDDGWAAIDRPEFLAELKKGLKPGGCVAIIDHYAEAGAAPESGNTVHRIDPAVVIADMEAAGFVVSAQSDMLRNPHDDLSKIVFDPELRGKTDRFIILFSKPE